MQSFSNRRKFLHLDFHEYIIICAISEFKKINFIWQGILDCLTGPCVTVPGVGKIQGSKKSTQFTVN